MPTVYSIDVATSIAYGEDDKGDLHFDYIDDTTGESKRSTFQFHTSEEGETGTGVAFKEGQALREVWLSTLVSTKEECAAYRAESQHEASEDAAIVPTLVDLCEGSVWPNENTVSRGT